MFSLIEKENNNIQSNSSNTITEQMYYNMVSIIMILLSNLSEKNFDLVKILFNLKMFLTMRETYKSNNDFIQTYSKLNNNKVNSNNKLIKYNQSVKNNSPENDNIHQIIDDIIRIGEGNMEKCTKYIIIIITNIIMKYILLETYKNNPIAIKAISELYESLDTLPIGSIPTRKELHQQVEDLSKKNRAFLIKFGKERREKIEQKNLLQKIEEVEKKQMQEYQESRKIKTEKTTADIIKYFEMLIKDAEIKQFTSYHSNKNNNTNINNIDNLIIKINNKQIVDTDIKEDKPDKYYNSIINVLNSEISKLSITSSGTNSGHASSEEEL